MERIEEEGEEKKILRGNEFKNNGGWGIEIDSVGKFKKNVGWKDEIIRIGKGCWRIGKKIEKEKVLKEREKGKKNEWKIIEGSERNIGRIIKKGEEIEVDEVKEKGIMEKKWIERKWLEDLKMLIVKKVRKKGKMKENGVYNGDYKILCWF